jgi:hypothetical protein
MARCKSPLPKMVAISSEVLLFILTYKATSVSASSSNRYLMTEDVNLSPLLPAKGLLLINT